MPRPVRPRLPAHTASRFRTARPAPATCRDVVAALPVLATSSSQAAYHDYARSLTAGGGVLIAYKDIDERFRFSLWRVVAWLAASGLEGWYLSACSPVESGWTNLLCWLAAASVNFLTVRVAIPVRRCVEIRPDCLILDGRDVFWRQYMENGWPDLRPKDETTFVLGGVYGTRFVEYGTLRRFDDNDRQPETFATHLEEAIRQMWETA